MGSPGIGQFVTDCGCGAWVNSNTSCSLAQNVHEEWVSQAGGSSALIVASRDESNQDIRLPVI